MDAISSAFSSATSGLSASSTRLAVSANNVANVNTDGFEPATTVLVEQASGGVRVTISDAARAGASSAPSGTDLIQETVSQMTSAVAFRASLATLRTAESMDATLMALGLPSAA